MVDGQGYEAESLHDPRSYWGFIRIVPELGIASGTIDGDEWDPHARVDFPPMDPSEIEIAVDVVPSSMPDDYLYFDRDDPNDTWKYFGWLRARYEEGGPCGGEGERCCKVSHSFVPELMCVEGLSCVDERCSVEK
jgi:hypothetical protein